ncbi:hypothetical protein J2Z44_003272 [Clostridium punense]|uniref:N-acetyltransferase domain-containing protein n=1 Tax=Clostridium punense TaxID=1054297 RepID=A0ABS4K6M4_9CLOT|nr:MULTISPECIES: GNAT family N-acetyltransferase [Clostridium]EQB85809.1 hypothetical protein M918_17625 [Clostridium sp. BL8]MBP2023435.1 hypothetical protein [Clostridium punense]
MKIKLYEKKHYDDILSVMAETWNFHMYFPQAKDRTLIYKMALDSILILYTYNYVVVDKSEKAVGLLVGTVNSKVSLGLRLNKLIRSSSLFIKATYYILTNRLGNKAQTLNTLNELGKVFKRLQRDKKQFDSSVELFMLLPSYRGIGIGRKLMDHFIYYCKKYGSKCIFLYTDRSCNFEFYEKYGFVKHDAIHNQLLPNCEYNTNGFVYKYYI